MLKRVNTISNLRYTSITSNLLYRITANGNTPLRRLPWVREILKIYCLYEKRLGSQMLPFEINNMTVNITTVTVRSITAHALRRNVEQYVLKARVATSNILGRMVCRAFFLLNN